MKRIFYLSLIFTLVACKTLEEPIEIISYEGSQIELFSGQLIKLKVGFRVQNKLWLPIKLAPSAYELFIDDQKIGNIYLDSLIKLKAHKENNLNFPIRIIPEPGFVTTAYKATKKPVVSFKITGYPKLGTMFIYKAIPFSKESQVETTQFQPYFPSF